MYEKKQKSLTAKIISYTSRSFIAFLQWCINILVILIATNQHVQFIGGNYVDYSKTKDFLIIILIIVIALNVIAQWELSITGEENG